MGPLRDLPQEGLRRRSRRSERTKTIGRREDDLVTTSEGSTADRDLLGRLLPAVSRSFALSLRVLPGSLRAPFGLTYLLARAADTIADTRALPPASRREAIEWVRRAIRGGTGRAELAVAADHAPAEQELLARLPDVLAAYRGLEAGDRGHSQAVLLTLTQAMLDALARFPAEAEGRVGALETRDDLDRYTYMNAGCVGEYWTDMVAAHRPRCAGRWNLPLMRSRGVRFGQGLQMVNVLRDLPRDLRIGRCYVPRVELAALGLAPGDLLDPKASARLQPLVARLIADTLDQLRQGLAYTLAVPRREPRLRLACAWPLLIGLATLARLARTESLLDPDVVVKVPRPEVRRQLVLSTALVGSNHGLRLYAERLAGRMSCS